MPSLKFVRALTLLLVMATLVACSKKDPNRKETSPVTGEVFVDGQAAGTLRVDIHPVAGLDSAQPTHSSAFTDEAGKFSIATYEAGDGVPAGEYVLTFLWGQVNPFSMAYAGPDKLKDRYLDPKKSMHKLTVEAGKPVDLGRIELTTK